MSKFLFKWSGQWVGRWIDSLGVETAVMFAVLMDVRDSYLNPVTSLDAKRKLYPRGNVLVQQFGTTVVAIFTLCSIACCTISDFIVIR